MEATGKATSIYSIQNGFKIPYIWLCSETLLKNSLSRNPSYNSNLRQDNVKKLIDYKADEPIISVLSML